MIKRACVCFILSIGLLFCLSASAWTWTDSDGDGVPDAKDACPETKVGVIVRSNGCDAQVDNDRLCLPTLDEQIYPRTCTQATPLVLNFEFAQAEVMFTQWQVFTRIKRFLQEHDVKLCLLGHTDSVGAEAGNVALSHLRALNVKRILVDDLGFNPDRFQVKGMADTHPVASNDFPEGRAMNRRVELFVEP